MSVLVDINILIRTIPSQHSPNKLAVEALTVLGHQSETLCVTPQNLYELWSVSTRPVSQNGLGLTVADTKAEIIRIKGLFQLLDETSAILPEWEKLVEKYQVSGKNSHDTHLVAAMVVHGVPRILSFNKTDFQRFSEIIVISPEEVVQGKTS